MNFTPNQSVFRVKVRGKMFILIQVFIQGCYIFINFYFVDEDLLISLLLTTKAHIKLKHLLRIESLPLVSHISFSEVSFYFFVTANTTCPTEVQSTSHSKETTKRLTFQIKTQRWNETEKEILRPEEGCCYGNRRKEGQ